MYMWRSASVLCLVVPLALVAIPSAAQEPLGDRISRWLKSKREVAPFSLDPGIAVAVVSSHGTQVDLCIGDGVRLQGSGEEATADTLFEIGSVTKTLVGLALGTLVDEGALRWDDYVADIFGPQFSFGKDQYVRDHVTVRDLLAHRSGLSEAQGAILTMISPQVERPSQLGRISLGHDFRQTFDYSNLGWELAGQVLRLVANSSSWCEAVRMRLLIPMGMSSSFCDGNALRPPTTRVAGVHKASPCDGHAPPARAFGGGLVQAPQLRAYEFVRTGAPGEFAWGASDAAGSGLCSIQDMSKLMALLLSPGLPEGQSAVPQVVRRETLTEMLSAQMVSPLSWSTGLGLPESDLADGLGFDLAGRLPIRGVPSSLAGARYAEKNGDTVMHKARMGLDLEHGIGVFVLSNLGGSIGDSMTALKFGILALSAGASEAEADTFMSAVLSTTKFWESTWAADATCTACGTVLGSFGPCVPGKLAKPPLPLEAFAGTYSNALYGNLLSIEVAADGGHLVAAMGPFRGELQFGPSSPVSSVACAEQGLPASGRCTMVAFFIPPEVAALGISNQNRTVAFPWGSLFRLPDASSLTLVVAEVTGDSWALGVSEDPLQCIRSSVVMFA